MTYMRSNSNYMAPTLTKSSYAHRQRGKSLTAKQATETLVIPRTLGTNENPIYFHRKKSKRKLVPLQDLMAGKWQRKTRKSLSYHR